MTPANFLNFLAPPPLPLVTVALTQLISTICIAPNVNFKEGHLLQRRQTKYSNGLTSGQTLVRNFVTLMDGFGFLVYHLSIE